MFWQLWTAQLLGLYHLSRFQEVWLSTASKLIADLISKIIIKTDALQVLIHKKITSMFMYSLNSNADKLRHNNRCQDIHFSFPEFQFWVFLRQMRVIQEQFLFWMDFYFENLGFLKDLIIYTHVINRDFRWHGSEQVFAFWARYWRIGSLDCILGEIWLLSIILTGSSLW